MSLRTFALLGISGLSLVAGCKETVGSADVRTQGIAMLTEVTAHSSGSSRVRTELRVGGNESNTFVKLEDGDRLVAEVDGDERVMESVSTGVYEADFDVGEGGAEFVVRFERSVDDDARDNHGTLPEPFDITSEFDSTPISRATEEVEITWEPSGESDDMEIEFDDGDGESCIFSEGDAIAGDPGSYVAEAGQLSSTGGDDPETCEVDVTVTRSRNGGTDTVLDPESRFVLKQIRSVTFVSAP